MSLRNRARKLMKATGLTYQQAIEKIRALGKAPAELRTQTGWTLEECDFHLINKAKIEVVTVEPRTRAELACQQLLHTGGARAVVLVNGWTVLAHAGARDSSFIFHPRMLMKRSERLPRRRKTIDLGGVLHALIVPIKKLHLIVIYEEWTLLLDKRVEKAVDYLEGLIEEDPLLAPPDGGDDGPGGLSAAAWESIEIFRMKKS